jgi:alpha-1,6-mannosyltransferase
MRIVRLANFVTTHSGGLRTALRNLGEGYQRAGHEAVLIVPGRDRSDQVTSQGRVITLPSSPSRSPTGPPCAGRAPGPGSAASGR